MNEVTKEEADEYLLIIVSDANFRRHGIRPSDLGRAMTLDDRVSAFAIFIALEQEAQAIIPQLPANRAFSCQDVSTLPLMFRSIFTSNLIPQ